MPDFSTIPALDRLAWLFHGFGARNFSENDLWTAAAQNGARVVLLRQVHSARVLVLDEAPAGLPAPPEADGTATRRPGLALVIKTADCLPLFLVDPEHRAVGAVHAGWRGTARRIAAEAVETMTRSFGTRPVSLLAALGPCIGGACYEVGEDVAAPFRRDPSFTALFSPAASRPGKYLFDLRAANRAQLETAGVSPANIHETGRCTHCDPALLSYRRDRRSDLRLFNFIGIRAS
jgi:YfiH family protein